MIQLFLLRLEDKGPGHTCPYKDNIPNEIRRSEIDNKSLGCLTRSMMAKITIIGDVDGSRRVTRLMTKQQQESRAATTVEEGNNLKRR